MVPCFPHGVETPTFKPNLSALYATSALKIDCFGAQALLCGLFISLSHFTRRTFAAYGAALLPFFWFNHYFVFVEQILNRWMAIDFLSNFAMLALCIWGYRSAPRG